MVATRADVVVISMPWAPAYCPSIQLGIVKSLLDDGGVSARTAHFNLELLKFVARTPALTAILPDADAYDRLSNQGPLGRWVFAVPPFDERAFDPARVEAITQLPYCRSLAATKPEVVERAMTLRRHIPEFLAQCADEVLDAKPRVVGFSCTFRQRVASLALAKILKQRDPNLKVVFGGTYMAGVMGPALLRAYDWVDVVVRGEAECVVVDLFRELVAGKRPEPRPGVCVRDGDSVVTYEEDERTADLRVSPIPVYDEYFERDAVGPKAFVTIPLETSRGCWWWRKKCRFCGVRDSDLAYRRKPIARVAEEMRVLATRHGTERFFFVDSIVQPKDLIKLLPRGDDRPMFRSWAQAKPTFSRSEVRVLAAAGLEQIFVGIESLSTPTLKLIRKGIDAVQAIRMLKWGREHGMKVTWNLLYGFPGESESEYSKMATLFPSLAHLNPPFGLMPLELDRASVYFDDASEYMIEIASPEAAYDPLLVLATERGHADAVNELAASFPFTSSMARATGTSGLEACRRALDEWIAAAPRSSLACLSRGDDLHIADRRATLPPKDHVLCSWESRLYLAFDAGASVNEACEVARVSRAAGVDFVSRMLEERLLIEDGDRYLSLAVGPPAPVARETRSRVSLPLQ